MTRYFSEFNRNLRELDLFKIFTVILILTNLYQTHYIVESDKNDKVIITPSIITSEFESVGNTFSHSYFEQVGTQLANALLTISPANVDISYDSIQKYFSTDPDEIKAIKEQLLEESERIKKDNIYQAFYVTKVIDNYKHNKFSVEGLLKSSVGNLPLADKKTVIDFTYKVVGKTLIIKSFEVK